MMVQIYIIMKVNEYNLVVLEKK